MTERKGGRKKGGLRTTAGWRYVTILMPPDLKDAVAHRALDEKRHASELIADAIRAYLGASMPERDAGTKYRISEAAYKRLLRRGRKIKAKTGIEPSPSSTAEQLILDEVKRLDAMTPAQRKRWYEKYTEQKKK